MVNCSKGVLIRLVSAIVVDSDAKFRSRRVCKHPVGTVRTSTTARPWCCVYKKRLWCGSVYTFVRHGSVNLVIHPRRSPAGAAKKDS